MMSDDFPNDFDIIVLGTGLTETIVAAAFSRIGLKVLHLERNDYYGGAYSNFNFESIENWRLANENLKYGDSETEISENVQKLLQDGESFVALPTQFSSAFNIKSYFYIRERTADEQARAVVKLTNSRFTFSDIKEPEDEKSQEPSKNVSEEQEKSSSLDSGVSSCTERLNNEINLDHSSTNTSFNEEGTVNHLVSSNAIAASQLETEKEVLDCEKTQQKKEWTAGDIRDDWRKYCIDISPKILFCSGELVDLLIQSDVARYCEFRSVSRVLTILNDKLQQVPCSRADVFSSKQVSLIEKRLMMKFLQFAADYNSNPQEYKDFLDKSFVEFLKSKKLTPNIQHYIQHAIAMVTDSELTQEGLKKTQKFLQSLGRYGNTAFLFPLYGTGELPQAFSRLSAVFGGIYCLTTSASHLIADSDKKCCAIVTSNGQRVSCRYVIAECSYFPSSYVLRLNKSSKISRAIFITDSSILPSESSELSLLHYLSPKDTERPVTVLELPSSACVCPKDTFLVHLTKVSSCDDPEEDFKEVREKMFTSETIGEPEKETKPKILWSIYFNQEDKSQVRLKENTISNVLVTSGGGDAGVDLDFCVAEARDIFHNVCPDEEFLPKPPNPEDILLVNDTEFSSEQGVLENEIKQNETNDAIEQLPGDKVDEDLTEKLEQTDIADVKRTEDH